MDDKGTLRVRMMGEFSMTWEGKKICGGVRAADSQFTRLLQILLHRRADGVDRMQLQNLLLNDSNAEDVHHLLRSVIYNTRKKLKKAGLPGDENIKFVDGIYRWTEEIYVEEDAEYFEKCCAAARAETDPDARLQKLLEACYSYKGDFLPGQTSLAWVASEHRRYKDMFRSCVEEAAAILKGRGDYSRLEELGAYASGVSPYNEWESLTIAAYMMSGKNREALQLYETTYEHYYKEFGTAPFLEKNNAMRRFAMESTKPCVSIEEVADELAEDPLYRGGMYCTHTVFRGIYRIFCRSVSGSGHAGKSFLMMCTLPEPEEISSKDEEKYKMQAERLKDAIYSSTQNTDIFCRYGKRQFLVILPKRTEEGCRKVIDSIDRSFRADRRGIPVSVSVMPIIRSNASGANIGEGRVR